MQPARGDRRPCSCEGCTGTMQFGRHSDNAEPTTRDTATPAVSRVDPTGWVCSADRDHFRQAS
jgi:hypothetical protein